MEEKVSIVVPVHNAAAYLKETVASVLAQTYGDWELLLVDDHSTDGSREIMERLAAGDGRFRLLSQAAGVCGAAQARNLGVSRARGRYLAFLDADDVWRPEKLSCQMDFLRREKAAFTFTSYEFGDENAQGTGKVVHAPHRLSYRQALSRTVIFTSTVLIDRSKVPEELLRMPDVASEDTATWWQILRAGYPACGLDEVLTVYRRPGKSLSSNKAVAVRRIWNLYRKREGLSLLSSAAHLCGWAWRAAARRLVGRRTGPQADGPRPRRKNDAARRLLFLFLSVVEMALLTGFYAYMWSHYFYHHIAWKTQNNFTFRGHVLVVGIYFFLLCFFSRTYGALKIGYQKLSDITLSQVFSLICVNVVSYFQLSLMYGWLIIGGERMIAMTFWQVLAAAVWNYLCNLLYRRITPPRELLLVHGERPIENILVKLASRPDKYHVAGNMDFRESIEQIEREAPGYDAVVLWDIPMEVRNVLLKYCYSRGIRIYTMPKIPDVIIKGSEQLHLFDTPILLTREYALTADQRIVKRLIDVLFSLMLLVAASPVMLLTALLVHIYDGGPVLYKQVRCTQNGKEFQILKFRSMRVDAEKDGVARLASRDDSRVTPIGRVIRAVRIDELPQLFNILKGDMSFIGPRPERPSIIAQYMKEMPEFAFRLRVKAGLAGYAQVYGKYNTTPYDKLKLDLYYIENYSVWLDLKLMLLTLKILFTPDSTEGIDADQVTAMGPQDGKSEGGE